MEEGCLTSNPVQYEYECGHRCGFYLRWYERKNSRKQATQDELDREYEKQLSFWIKRQKIYSSV